MKIKQLIEQSREKVAVTINSEISKQKWFRFVTASIDNDFCIIHLNDN